MKNDIKSLINKINLHFIFLVLTFISLYSIVSLNFNSTQGADYEKYKNYLNFFLFDQDKTNLEQGLIYFFIIAWFIDLFTYKLNPINTEQIFSLGIQVGNFFILFIGLLGLNLLLKEFQVSNKNRYLTMSMICFFPQTISLVTTFKPEILAVALLFWSIYFVEKFFNEKNSYYIYLSLLPLSLLATLKGSVTGMVGLFFLIRYFKKMQSMNFKILILCFTVLVSISSIILYENYQSNNLFILDPPHDEEIYNSKAPFSIVYKIDPVKLFSKPYQHEHKDSIIAIYLLDTFDDYFQLYWNFDKSLFDQNRKDLFLSDGSDNLFKVDIKNRFITYNGPLNFYLMFLRQYFAIFFGFIYYFLIFKYSRKYKVNRVFYLAPLIGISISVINNVFGFPQNTFDPTRADTFKTFYFSFLIILSFSFVVSQFFQDKRKKGLYLIVYFLVIFFILGFPKANNDEFDFKISENNKYSLTCNLNSVFLKNTLFETSNIDCPSLDEIVCDEDIFRDNNSFNLVNSENSFKEVTEYDQCIDLINMGYRYDNEMLSLKNFPLFNFMTYILFIMSIIYAFIKNNEK